MYLFYYFIYYICISYSKTDNFRELGSSLSLRPFVFATCQLRIVYGGSLTETPDVTGSFPLFPQTVLGCVLWLRADRSKTNS